MIQVPIPRKMTVCHEKHKADLIEFQVENITPQLQVKIGHFARVARCIGKSPCVFLAQPRRDAKTAKTVHVKNTAHNFSTYPFVS